MFTLPRRAAVCDFQCIQNSTFYILHLSFKKRSFDSLRSLRMTEREAMLGRDDKSEAARPQDDRKRASLGRDDRGRLF